MFVHRVRNKMSCATRVATSAHMIQVGSGLQELQWEGHGLCLTMHKMNHATVSNLAQRPATGNQHTSECLAQCQLLSHGLFLSHCLLNTTCILGRCQSIRLYLWRTHLWSILLSALIVGWCYHWIKARPSWFWFHIARVYLPSLDKERLLHTQKIRQMQWEKHIIKVLIESVSRLFHSKQIMREWWCSFDDVILNDVLKWADRVMLMDPLR